MSWQSSVFHEHRLRPPHFLVLAPCLVSSYVSQQVGRDISKLIDNICKHTSVQSLNVRAILLLLISIPFTDLYLFTMMLVENLSRCCILRMYEVIIIIIYFQLATRPGFARVVEHIMGTNMFCLS